MIGNTHTCTARGCNHRRDEDKLMCSYHWNKVPANLRAAIFRSKRQDRKVEHVRYCNEARDAVAAIEGALPR